MFGSYTKSREERIGEFTVNAAQGAAWALGSVTIPPAAAGAIGFLAGGQTGAAVSAGFIGSVCSVLSLSYGVMEASENRPGFNTGLLMTLFTGAALTAGVLFKSAPEKHAFAPKIENPGLHYRG